MAYRREPTGEPGIYKLVREDTGEVVSFRVVYRVGGKQRVQTFKGAHRLTDAKRFKAREVTAKVEAERFDPTPGRVSLQEVFDKLHATRPYAAATVALHEALWKHVEPYLGTRPVNRITTADVDHVLGRIERPGARDKTRAILSAVLEYAVSNGWITSNPAKRRRTPSTRAERMQAKRHAPGKTHPQLSAEELARLLEEMPARYRTLVHVMARLGLRPGEAIALQVGKFDSLKGTLLIDTSVSGFTKTGEARTVRVPSKIRDELAEHIARYSDPANSEALIFPAERDGQLNLPNFRNRQFSKAAQRAGVEGITPNDLRHSAVAWAVSLGASVYDVQRLVGHANAAITLTVYGYLFDQGQQRLMERMDKALAEEEAKVPAEAEVIQIGGKQ